jgi:acyl dehydratase
MTEKRGWEGRFYEDFEVGDLYKHFPGRTVIEADNVWFTLLTMNTHPLHFNTDYASRTEFGLCLVNSALTLSIVTGMSVKDVSQNAFANLGWEEVKLPHPLFVGDTLYAESEVLSKRESKSNPDVGIITVRTRGYKQDSATVIEFKRTVMVYKKGKLPKTSQGLS